MKNKQNKKPINYFLLLYHNSSTNYDLLIDKKVKNDNK